MPPTIPAPVICHDHILGTVPQFAPLIRRAETKAGMSEFDMRRAFGTPKGFHQSLHFLFLMLLRYRELGQQVFCVGPRLQEMFQATSLEGIPRGEFQLPFDTFYVALPGCSWRIWGGPTNWHQLDGVMVSRVGNTLKLYLWAQENEHSMEAGDDASFWLSLDLDEMDSLGIDMESYIDRILNDASREHQMSDLIEYFDGTPIAPSFREQSRSVEVQQTARSVLRVIMNMALYIGSVSPDVSEDPTFQKSQAEHRKLQREAKSLKKLKNKNRKKAGQRGRKLATLHQRMTRLSTANVVWIGRTIEKAYMSEGGTRPGEMRHHWVRGHWRPKVLSTINLRAQAEVAFKKAKDRVWELRQSIAKDPEELDMAAYAAELEEAARELGEASLALGERDARRQAVADMPDFQTTGTRKRKWVQPYERNKDAAESVPSHHYKM